VQDLFGTVLERRVIEIEIYADEIKPFTTTETSERWAYIGILVIPYEKKDELLASLLSKRRENGCDSEIKSNDLDHGPKHKLADAWLDILLSDQQERRIFFNILGINLSNLNYSAFGGSDFPTIYNRFFRTCVLGALASFFPTYNIVVRNVYHDAGDIQQHKLFPWHTISQLADRSDEVIFSCSEIQFIESDHREPNGCPESHLIQFIDLISGLLSQCLDCTSRKASRIKVSGRLHQLLHRMMHAPNNRNSSYGHCRKYTISFFPSRKLSDTQMFNSIARASSGFYQERRIVQQDRESGQLPLPLTK
jgi:hypothetical protein